MPPKKSKKLTSLKVPETESARKKLTVAQLRNVLVSLGLSVDGLKADLLLRLETHLFKQVGDAKSNPFSHAPRPDSRSIQFCASQLRVSAIANFWATSITSKILKWSDQFWV